jgi:hypothetical protein
MRGRRDGSLLYMQSEPPWRRKLKLCGEGEVASVGPARGDTRVLNLKPLTPRVLGQKLPKNLSFFLCA